MPWKTVAILPDITPSSRSFAAVTPAGPKCAIKMSAVIACGERLQIEERIRLRASCPYRRVFNARQTALANLAIATGGAYGRLATDAAPNAVLHALTHALLGETGEVA